MSAERKIFRHDNSHGRYHWNQERSNIRFHYTTVTRDNGRV